MNGIQDNFGSGGEGLTPNGSSRVPALEDHLKALNEQGDDVIGWDTAVVVSANTVTLARAGRVLAVDATAASATGPKAISFSAPLAGQVQVVFATDGVSTLNFFGADAVTEIAVQQPRAGKDLHDA